MALKNSVTLYGNMGKELKVTEIKNGAKVARFDVATHSTYTDKKGQKTKRTEWHKVFAWGNAANFIENYGHSGASLCIHGKLVNRTYMNKDGNPRTITEVEAKEVLNMSA